MRKPTKNHNYYTVVKGGRKGSKRGQTRKVRKGARNPGATKIGSIRHPF